MQKQSGWRATAVFALALIPQVASAQETVLVDGSSTVFPITEAVAEEFQNKFRGRYRVTVGVSGTGGGFKKFCRGDTDISNASRPISAKEREECRAAGIGFMELPVSFDALTVVVNPRNDWVGHLTVDELETMWAPEAQGKVTNWNQIRSSFPDRPLNLFGAGTDSGTYDYFTEAVMGKSGASRGDYTASEDDNVLVQGVVGDVNALGFFGLAYYEENSGRLKAVPISWKGSDPVEPSVENARTGKYQPLSRPLFIYISAKSADSKASVREFVSMYTDGEEVIPLVREVGYVPLPEEGYELAQQIFAERKTGTVFAGGAQVGVSIDDLMKLERQQ